MTTKPVRRAIRRVIPRSSFGIGIALIVLALVGGTALFNKNKIMTTLKPGDTIHVHFASGPVLVPYLSKAKIAFVPVGVVTGVKRDSDGTADVRIKLDKGIRSKLGSTPSAVIRPTTLLGGNYFVDLVPGGDHVAFHGAIPVSRTEMPVELDKIARALQPDALKSMQTTTTELDSALARGSGSALDRLAADAPSALVPAAHVLQAVQGTERYTDLNNLVSGLESAARGLTANNGELDSIIGNLTRTSAVLSNRAGDISSAIAQLPGALQSADTGLHDLDVSLAKLRATVDPINPSITELATTLRAANPVLVKAVPVVDQLNSVLVDLDPIVNGLAPVSKGYTDIIKAFQGPVLDRINGPVKTAFMSPYHGSGQFKNTGSDKPLYQEVAYMAATMDRASSMADRNGNSIAFNPGVGPGSVGGLPISLEQMFTIITDKLGLTPRLGGK